ncbi:MAG: multidrug effflux MFS transporter [Propionibacteriaceae bacterium]|nr:multidrug effflux MFS transporter [Propionibacteriaceae bacterium]
MPDTASHRRPNYKYVLMLGSMCALGAISTDMYLPNLPDVQSDLRSTAAAAQFTITAMMIGNAVGQLVIGPLSDRFGRRRPVLVGVGLHILVSVLCALAPSMMPLIVFRACQGFFNASAGVVAMAVIRDRFVGRDASRLMSRLMLVIGVAPLFAPTIGGYIGDWISWRGIFAVLGVYGVFLFVAVLLKLPETLPPERRIHSAAATWKGYSILLRDRTFIALAILPGLGSGVLMSYVVGSPYVFKQGYSLSTTQFGLLFAANGIGLVGGAQVSAALVKHFTPATMLRVVAPLMAVLTGWLFLVALTEWGGLPLLLVSLFIVCCLINFTPPNASSLALGRHGERAGTAAACIGFLQFGVAGLVAPVVGLVGETAPAMSAVMFASAVLAVVVVSLATPLYRPGGAASMDTASIRPTRPPDRDE